MSSVSDYSDEYSEHEEDILECVTENDVDPYTIITNIFADILTKRPLINTGPISEQMESRAVVINDLHNAIYDLGYLKKYNLFYLHLGDLNKAIIGTAYFIEDMDDEYETLECSVDTGSPRSMIRSAFEMGSPKFGELPRDFEEGFHEYLDEAMKNLVETFNDFISRDNWIELDTKDRYYNKRPLPFTDKLKITL